jgi:hypothetical protein
MQNLSMPAWPATDPADSFGQRLAERGELCTCGRPAVIVYLTGRGPFGYCGQPDGGARTRPCPWCGVARHRTAWGEPTRCPDYALRAPAPSSTAATESDAAGTNPAG